MEKARLKRIYQKTDGYCHICHGRLTFPNYSVAGSPGAWEIEHSKPRFKGGSDHMNNLYPAHISCNRSKGTQHIKTVRLTHGNTRAPYSKFRKQSIRENNTAAGTVIGGLVGTLFGPIGLLVGASIGAAIGNGSSPNR